jgi:hypothetical protein
VEAVRPPERVYIRNELIYVADSESTSARNPGWLRGIRIGSLKDGKVLYRIVDPLELPGPARRKVSPWMRRAMSTAGKWGRGNWPSTSNEASQMKRCRHALCKTQFQRRRIRAPYRETTVPQAH